MSESVYLLTICLPLGTILLIFGMKYFSAIQQARAQLAQDQAYRQIATQMAQTQAETAKTLSSIDAVLTALDGRTASIEKILKDVE